MLNIPNDLRQIFEEETDPIVQLAKLQIELAKSIDDMAVDLESAKTNVDEYKKLETKGRAHSRRQTGLRLLINSIVQTLEIQKKVSLDLKSTKFKEVIKFFLEIVEETFVEVMGPDENLKNNFFIQLSNKFEGWEERVHVRLENMKE